MKCAHVHMYTCEVVRYAMCVSTPGIKRLFAGNGVPGGNTLTLTSSKVCTSSSFCDNAFNSESYRENGKPFVHTGV